MSFLNLGSFGEGFVTGFATEANKALKDSINRINTRVDKLKDFQVQRAIKDQDKRRAEIEENREALERAYAVLGGDANAERAIAYAGGLLKERGSVEAFNQRIDELQTAKDNGFDIMTYFDRASFDAPAGTLDDYAIAAAGAPQTFATDYRIPEGMDTGTGRTLVGTILGKDIDITGRAMQEAGEEIRALYGADVTTLAQLPTITFKAEEFSLRDKSPSERLDYATKKLALANVQGDPVLLEKYTKMRDEQEQAVLNTKDEEDMKAVLEEQLKRFPAGSDKAKDIQTQLKAVNRSIKIKAAETSDDAFAGIDLEIEFALNDMMDAYEKTGTIDRTEVDKLEKRKLELTGKPGKTVGEEIAEEREELNRQVDRKLITPEQFAAKVAILNQRAAIIEKNKPKGATSAAKMNSWSSIFVRAIETEEKNVLQGFDQTERDAHARISDLIKGGGAGQEARLRSSEEEADAMAIYDRIEAAKRNVSKKVVEDQLSVLDPALDVEAFLAAVPFGVAPVASTDSPAPAASAQTAAALGGETPAAAEADTTADRTSQVRAAYSDDAAGATKMVNDLLRNGISIQAALDDAKAKGYKNPEFISVLEAELGTDSAVAKMAIEDTAIEGEPDRQTTYANTQQVAALEAIRNMPILQKGSQRLKIREVSSKLDISEDEAKTLIESLDTVAYSPQDEIKIAKDIVDSVMGTAYRETREIAKQLNIPMDAARRLHKRVTDNSKATGGLMSRK
jgi:hypothetical protein